MIPYIDSHCHTHGFPYDAWETVGATGIAAAVISAGNPLVHREIHEEVPDLADVRRYWDEPIRLLTKPTSGTFAARNKMLFQTAAVAAPRPTAK